jgi:hypothetical protein
LWTPGTTNVLTTGAVMAFEADHGLNTDGLAGIEVWNALLQAVASRQSDPRPYTYLLVDESIPETLSVWEEGNIVLQSPTNTGVPGAATAVGTFPVYLRFTSTTMKGTDADGVKYDVVGVPWVSYFNGGDAVHGYWRYYWGYPQSNGCVELPVNVAEEVYPLDYYGTLVTVY